MARSSDIQIPQGVENHCFRGAPDRPIREFEGQLIMEAMANQRPHQAGEWQGEQEKVPSSRDARWVFQPKRPEVDRQFRPPTTLLVMRLFLIVFELVSHT